MCLGKTLPYLIYRLLLSLKDSSIYIVIDALSTMLRLLEKELKVASWLIEARPRMELVELYNEE